MNSGQELWKKAKTLIPGGCQLLSKRPERFLPGLWPVYYSRAKGCEVWDLDGRKFYDFAQMGVGSCVLGYADDDVNDAMIKAVQSGSMSSLNCPEEVELAELMVQLNPWAQMVRFTRSGGEACAVAIRIARAASGRDKVVFCGYHGWHDWYLSANLQDDKSLDGQLLPGLKPRGVPRQLKGSALTFNYNKLEELEAVIAEHGSDVGVIYMEACRGEPPAPGFLEGVRRIASKIGAVLIFDEVTSGFRINVGGAHAEFGVEPDMAVYGKAMGNGFPISAVVGRREVMDAAQDSFISSTFWTEKVGFVAALATIRKMQKHDVPKCLIRSGETISAGWRKSGERYGLPVKTFGIAPLSSLSFKTDYSLEWQTYYAQEMLDRGYLVGAAVYSTWAYTDEILGAFLRHTDDVFAKLADHVKSGDVTKQLRGGVMQPGFKRLS